MTRNDSEWPGMATSDRPAGGNDYEWQPTPCPLPFALCLFKTKDKREKIKDWMRMCGFENLES